MGAVTWGRVIVLINPVRERQLGPRISSRFRFGKMKHEFSEGFTSRRPKY